MTTIYTSKKTGVAYTLESTEIVDGKTKFTLYSEQEQDRVTTTESVLKRWYKKEIVVDFTAAEEKPAEEAEPEQEMLPMAEENTAEAEQEATTEETKEEKVMNEEIKVSKNTKKQSNRKANTYEEQKWGLVHTRMSIDAFCNLLDLSSVEYDEKAALILLQVGADTVATRRAWENPITGSVWFRYKNYEYELTDMAYVSGVELETA